MKRKRRKPRPTQHQRELAVELCAKGHYYPEDFCDISKTVGYSSCSRFKKDIVNKRRRLAIERAAKKRFYDRQPPWKWEQ